MRLIALLLLVCLMPVSAAAQGTATLVADTVTVTGDTRLTAQGNVEAYYDGTTLSARSITYDRTADRLLIEGPILIRTADGAILTAEAAELDPQLSNGILRGARLVLDQRLQLAANQITRIDGFDALTRTVATSCQVCGTRAPVWDIRAETVLHDVAAQQLYFENATLRVRGIPILWVPRMRLPDPTLTRSTGLLIPRIRTTDQLGAGLKLPYFIRIGDRRDLTLTPYVSSRTDSLEARYRQAYVNGEIEVTGVIARDDIPPDEVRGTFAASGRFDLGQDYLLKFSGQAVTDEAFLLDYGYSDRDRIASGVTLTQVRDGSLLIAQATYYESLRKDENDASLPPVVLSFDREWRTEPPVGGGILTLAVSSDAIERFEGAAVGEGRDVSRLGSRATWQRTWIAPGGLVLAAEGDLALDYYDIRDDPVEGSVTGVRVGPAAAVTLSWPLLRATAGGATDLISPVVGLGWSESYGLRPPNEDSTLPELDEGNLFSLTRSPGDDAREEGFRLSLGASWTRTMPGGTATTLGIGRVLQSEAQPAYSVASGQADAVSDWLVTTQIDLASGFGLGLRTLVDEQADFNKTEARLGWANDAVQIDATYLWLPSDPSRDRTDPASEWTVDTAVDLADRWTLRTQARYDVAADELARVGLGVGWRNECVTVDLSTVRSYTSLTSDEPTTSFDFSVNLTGFSAGRNGSGAAGACRD